MDLEFEWDPAKAAANLAKHKISFEDACAVFVDPNLLEQVDRRHGPEIRYQVLGSVESRVLFVVYAMRDNSVRLISARKASRSERERYEAGSF